MGFQLRHISATRLHAGNMLFHLLDLALFGHSDLIGHIHGIDRRNHVKGRACGNSGQRWKLDLS